MNPKTISSVEGDRKNDIEAFAFSADILPSDSPLGFLVNSFSGAIALYEFDFENSYIKRLRGNDNFFEVFNVPIESRCSYDGNIIDLIHPEDSPAILQALKSLEVNGKTAKSTLRMRSITAFDTDSYATLSVEAHALTRTKKSLSLIAIFKSIDEDAIEPPKTQVNFTSTTEQYIGTYRGIKKTGLFTIRFDGRCHLACADDSFFEICEISREEGEKRVDTILYDILYPEDVQHIFTQMEKTLVGEEKTFECYVRFLTYKKNICAVRERGRIRKEANGIFIDIEVTDLTDISTFHKKSDMDEGKLQNVLSGPSVTVWNIKENKCTWSKEVQLTFGVPAETENPIDTLCVSNILYDDSTELFKNILKRLRDGEFSITEDLWFHKGGNKSVCRRTTFFSEHDENGEILKISAIGKDVTKEVLGVEYIDIEEVFEGMPGGILVVDIETEVLRYANDDYFKIIGFTRDELKNRFGNTPRRLIQATRKNTTVAQMAAEMKEVGRTTFEGQTICPDGRKIWVHSDIKRIGKNLFCIVTDITNHKRIVSKLKEEQMFQQMANDITDDIIFRFDVKSNSVQYIGHAIENFNLRTSLENYPASIIDRDIIYNEDISIFMSLMQNIIDGKEVPHELRLKDIYGNVEWYRIEYQLAFENEKPIYAVGKVVNIEKEKMLAVQVAVDSLTGCFNQGAIKISIQQILDTYVEGMQHAFLLIDIDNFENINCTQGKEKGDAVLKELAMKIKNIFRGSDLVGRIGGDEFVVFMCDYGDSRTLNQKMEQLVKTLQNTYNYTNNACFVSASIGVALCPENGLSYEDLYNNSDFALCEAKGRGKNQFCIFLPGRCNR